MRRRRGRVQRVGVRQPLLLRDELDVLALGGLGVLDLRHAVAQVLGLAGTLPRHRRELVQLGLDLRVPVMGPLVGGQHLRELRPGKPVKRLPLPAWPQQLLLVGLAVHRHQVVGQVGQQRYRHGPAARRRT